LAAAAEDRARSVARRYRLYLPLATSLLVSVVLSLLLWFLNR
jgi:hypothetical protein